VDRWNYANYQPGFDPARTAAVEARAALVSATVGRQADAPRLGWRMVEVMHGIPDPVRGGTASLYRKSRSPSGRCCSRASKGWIRRRRITTIRSGIQPAGSGGRLEDIDNARLAEHTR